MITPKLLENIDRFYVYQYGKEVLVDYRRPNSFAMEFASFNVFGVLPNCVLIVRNIKLR
jgi:hypothetical protein